MASFVLGFFWEIYLFPFIHKKTIVYTTPAMRLSINEIDKVLKIKVEVGTV